MAYCPASGAEALNDEHRHHGIRADRAKRLPPRLQAGRHPDRGICDVADAASAEYLLKFDTLSGRFPDPVSVRNGSLFVYGREIPILAG